MAALVHGVLGGTFDPVHRGHLELAEHAQQQLALDDVLWIPAGDPWRKTDRKITPSKHRLEMVRLAIEIQPDWRASPVDIERDGPTYSVDTLTLLREQHQGDDFVLLLGQDALEDLPDWREPERLVELARLAVAKRGEERPTAAELGALVPGLAGRLVWLDMPLVLVSSTQVRGLASKGTPLTGFVPEAVERYIHAHHLYGAG